jgi:hypothetical protein
MSPPEPCLNVRNPLSAVTKNFTSAGKLMYVLSTCRWQEMGCLLKGFNFLSRLLKNTHLLRYAYPSSLQRTCMYASFLRISRALHLDVFEQPGKSYFFNNLLGLRERSEKAFPPEIYPSRG